MAIKYNKVDYTNVERRADEFVGLESRINH
jgi:hypothetical protein